jgi:adenosylcobinamide-phosphate synthase
MSFFAVLFALMIEQLKPLPRDNWVHDTLISWTGWAGRNFDAGRDRHAIVVWCVTVLAPAIAAALAYWVIAKVSLLGAFVFDIAILYLTLGFRQFSHYFTDIRAALDRGEEAEARRLLAEWRHLDASELPRTELLRHVLEYALLAAHRHVLYRMAEFASRYWAFKSRTLDVPANERLMHLAQRSFSLIDHVPARMTAFGFAVVGNFEEAVNGWRRDALLWLHPNEGILLASAAGAIGVQLGGQAAPGVTPDRSKTFDVGGNPEAASARGSTPGSPAQAGHLQSVVGLVWRSVILWMLLAALLSLANLLG